MLVLFSQRNVGLQRRPGETARNAQWYGDDTLHLAAWRVQRLLFRLFTDGEGSRKRRSGQAISGGSNWTIGPFRTCSSGFMTRHKNNSDAALYSPPLVAHAPRLARAALLPHFYHTCEGLHTWLPLGDQRHLPLHTHIGPGTKPGRKQTCYQRVIRVFN